MKRCEDHCPIAAYFPEESESGGSFLTFNEYESYTERGKYQRSTCLLNFCPWCGFELVKDEKYKKVIERDKDRGPY